MNVHVFERDYHIQRFFLWSLLVLLILWSTTITAQAQPIEVGTVNWNRDFDATLKRSAEEDKPVLVLFQEVPGCTGCQTFGQDVLSHRLLVEAIETEFLPLLVYNNRPEDAELLTRYQEPAWNYQVIRFLNGEGEDIIPRKDRVWTLQGVAQRMEEALRAFGKEVPPYLTGLALEHDEDNLEDAAFGMYCFWSGEMDLGSLDGVARTEAGYLDGREVVRLWYHNKTISLDELARQVSQKGYAEQIYVKAAQTIDESQAKKEITLPIGQFDETHYSRARASNQKKTG